jgi:hypothetical protein
LTAAGITGADKCAAKHGGVGCRPCWGADNCADWSCDSVDSTVTCTTCKAGFTGATCADPGTVPAASKCAAAGATFDKDSGSLVSCSPCDAGYKGPTCSDACGDGKYGPGCMRSCEAPDGCDSKVPPFLLVGTPSFILCRLSNASS